MGLDGAFSRTLCEVSECVSLGRSKHRTMRADPAFPAAWVAIKPLRPLAASRRPARAGPRGREGRTAPTQHFNLALTARQITRD